MTTTTIDPQVLEALGLHELEPEGQEELLLDLSELVFESAIIRILEQMDEETKGRFDQLLDTDPTQEEMQDFLNQHVPGASETVEETAKEIYDDIIAVTGESPD